ncbi:MAG: YjbE family putative metal transport protein [Xanthobacteraceae bacterium]
MLLTNFNDLAQQPLWSAVPQIVFINILLSGDNAVVIAMACRALPRRQRILGLVIGEAVAVLLLIIFAAVLARVLQWPYLRIIGGLALIYIGAKLLVPPDGDEQVEASANLWRAVRIVIAADIVMSFDNIVAVVQIANGDLGLLAIGLAVSIPIIIAGAAIIARLIERLPILIWAGAALLGWIAGQTIAEDQSVIALTRRVAGVTHTSSIELAVGCAGAVLVIALGIVWRAWRKRTAPRNTVRHD